MADSCDGVVLVVAGRVRRGAVLVPSDGDACDECGRGGDWLLVSATGLRTTVCSSCRPRVGEPQPPVWGGRAWPTAASVTAAIAARQPAPPYGPSEQHERDMARWQRATRKHGFRRVAARTATPSHQAMWAPYAR